MKVHMTFELDEHMRRAIAHRVGKDRPASWSDCRRLIEGLVTADLEAIAADFDADERREPR